MVFKVCELKFLIYLTHLMCAVEVNSIDPYRERNLEIHLPIFQRYHPLLGHCNAYDVLQNIILYELFHTTL